MQPGLPPRPNFLPPGFGTVGHEDFVEIIVPPPVPWTPSTPAWAILAGLVVGAMAAVVLRGIRRFRAAAYRRATLAELSELRALSQSHRADAVARLPGLLKRCALAAFPRERVASLAGQTWLEFLESAAPGALSAEAKRDLGMLVLHAPTAVPESRDAALFDGVEQWVRRHRA